MSFKQTFILKCLDYMEKILADEQELEQSICHFIEDKNPGSRYQLNTKITEASQWSEQDKLNLSAAVFEAIARTTQYFYVEDDERAQEINKGSSVFLEQYLFSLTENTNPENRLMSVKNNIRRIKDEMKNKMEHNLENPYAFFSPITSGLVLMAAATTVALLAYRS
ncbi:Uncharacterised protein [Legionella wadsworthii]|uniref:Uncharacterized protein n=1 Tax=Legionella wadsworthii TaxID=28088 RepID=A0A378LRD1_9GAMM|nr:hypothetical protein [Legionella wadsworthii]STY28379.1 Uncharacterised protein [Legionella wadsworthii]